ncbi:MAG: phosphate acyltransferase [Propionicimonas sp.]
MFTTFTELRQHALTTLPVQRCAVAGAANRHALEAVFAAAAEGYVTPVLIGPAGPIRGLIEELGIDGRYELVDCDPLANPAQLAVDLVRAGEADFILKGGLQTADLLRPILNKATGLNDSGFITHFGLMQLAGYPKLLAMSDAAVIPRPTLEDKVRIVAAGVRTLRQLGIPRPVVAALCAAENVSEKMPETLDALRLSQLAAEGEFGDAVVLGPISYDLATSAESAAIKGYDNPHAGNVDLLLVPELVTGNVMSKIWNADHRNLLAGCLIGARVPVGLTSRSASMAEKLNSLLLCSVLSAAGARPDQESLT